MTPNCKRQCQGCGAARFGGGICFEKRNAEGEIEDGAAQTLMEYAHLHESKETAGCPEEMILKEMCANDGEGGAQA
ncbi:MAG: hypothetical protein ACLR0F_20115 [Eisenbergiella sp.]